MLMIEGLDPDNIILLAQVGSKAYGTTTPDSDDDHMAVCLAPMQHYLGLSEWGSHGTFEQKKSDGSVSDFVAYELKKFLRLCIAFNPNVIPLLFLPRHCYDVIHPAGQLLLDNRQLFYSRQAYHTFVGYAKSQLHKVKNEVTGKLGEKRKELVEMYGYDTKFAYHTVRLMRMCNEFLWRREMFVCRTGIDADELVAIRDGEWSLEQFTEEVEFLFQQAESILYGCDLPDNADTEAIQVLCMQIIREWGK